MWKMPNVFLGPFECLHVVKFKKSFVFGPFEGQFCSEWSKNLHAIPKIYILRHIKRDFLNFIFLRFYANFLAKIRKNRSNIVRFWAI